MDAGCIAWMDGWQTLCLCLPVYRAAEQCGIPPVVAICAESTPSQHIGDLVRDLHGCSRLCGAGIAAHHPVRFHIDLLYEPLLLEGGGR